MAWCFTLQRNKQLCAVWLPIGVHSSGQDLQEPHSAQGGVPVKDCRHVQHHCGGPGGTERVAAERGMSCSDVYAR